MRSLIVAMDEQGLIGREGGLPWHLPADLGHFRRVTVGQTVVMGRKTFESLKKPLPDRVNVVLTRDPTFVAPGCHVVHSIGEVLGQGSFVVIGGSEIYRQFLPHVELIYLTRIHQEFEGDAYFPALSPQEWELIWARRGPYNDRNRYPHTYQLLRRRG